MLLIPSIVRFARRPIGIRHQLAIGHPAERSFLRQIASADPKRAELIVELVRAANELGYGVILISAGDRR